MIVVRCPLSKLGVTEMRKVHGLILVALGFFILAGFTISLSLSGLFGIPIGLVIVAAGIWIYRKASFSERLDSLIISLLRSRARVSVDDVIVEARCSASEATDRLNYLVSKALVKSIIEQGRHYYVLA